MHTIKIEVICPGCKSSAIIKNGKKSKTTHQNYRCKTCSRQFILDKDKVYEGSKQGVFHKIKRMLSRGCGVKDIAVIEQISIGRVLSVIKQLHFKVSPKRYHYDTLEIDELWSYVQKKENKQWIIYAYDRETGEIVAWVKGKRDAKTARKLRKKLRELGVTYNTIASDDWKSFKTAFKDDNHIIGKEHTKGIEGNNCRIRHRMKRLSRKTCCFSKNEENHWKVFELVVFYINFGFV